MATTATPYGRMLGHLGDNTLNLTSANLMAMLTTSTYVPDVDTHEFLSDVTNEITGTGYAGGGLGLSNITWTYDAGNHRWVLGADPLLWTGATFTARYMVIYADTGNPTTSPLVGYVDYGVDKSPAAEDFQQSFSNGVLRLTAIIGA
jgi:hypothetical protein